MGRCGPRKIESVAACAISHPVGFGFGWTQGCFLLAVRHLPSFGHLVVLNKEIGVGPSDAVLFEVVFPHALGQSAKVV